MEIDGDLEVIRIAIAAGALLDGGDLRVQALGDGVGDAMREVGQHVGRWRAISLAASIIGVRRLCVAQKYQRFQNFVAQPARLVAPQRRAAPP